MKPKNARFVLNYILSPAYILILFRIMFFEDHESFTEKIVLHKTDPKMYLALLLCFISLIVLHWGMKTAKTIKTKSF